MNTVSANTFRILGCVAIAGIAAACGGTPNTAVLPEGSEGEEVSLLGRGRARTLLVGNTQGNTVLRFNPRTGGFLGEFIPESAGLVSPDTLILGPDANGDGRSDLYISNGNQPANSGVLGSSNILRFDAITGSFIDAFVRDDPTTTEDETGGLFRPYGLAFGPDGNLYVSSFLTDQILVYDGNTGEFLSVFATGDQQPGGLNGPNGLLFDDQGQLYVTTQGSVAINGLPDFSFGLPSQVLVYEVDTRSSRVFATPDPSPDSFGFVSLLGLAFAPQGRYRGDLFVSDFANDIRVYDSETGVLKDVLSTNYTGTVPSSNFIGSLTFDGDFLFTVGFDNRPENNTIGAVLRYNSSSGQPQPSQGNEGPLFVAPDPILERPIGILAY